jgi:MFS family permease
MQQEMMLVIRDVFIQTSVAYLWLSPAIHVATVILLLTLIRQGRQTGRIADAFFGVLFIFMAFSNHIAVTENYGLVVIAGNLVQIVIVGLFWLWDAFKPRNVYVFSRLPTWRYWVVPLAFLAFWSPIAPDLSPDFSPLLLLTSSFGVMFCPTTPVIIALLTLIYPKVNKYVLMVTSFVGFLIGIFNAIALLLMPGYSIWNFILHIPLISISLYGLLLTRVVKEKPREH